MKKYWNHRIGFWLRIILLICGLLVDARILYNYKNVRSDFVQDYIAAISLRQGSSLYGENTKKLESEMLGFSGPPNFHPPFNALLFLPFSFLTYGTAFVVLGIFSIISLLLINLFVVKGVGLNGDWLLNFSCFTLFWYPVIYCLAIGQTSMIIAACLVGGWFCLRSKKTYIAGFLFAIATLMKLFPGLVLLYLFMSKNWRTIFSMVSFIIIGFFVTTCIVGFDNVRTYAIVMIARDINEWRGFVINHSIVGIVTRIFSDTGWTESLIQFPRFGSLLIVLLDSLILIYTILKMRVMAVKKELADYAFGLTIVAMLLLSPITWGNIFPVLILPIGLLLKEYIVESSSRKRILSLLVILFLSLPDMPIVKFLMAIHYPYRMPWYSMLLTLGPSAGIVLLWIVLIRRVGDSRVRIGKCH